MIGIGFVHFRTTNLSHLDAAWYTLSKQDFTGVSDVILLDNNTEDTYEDIVKVTLRYPLPVPWTVIPEKHGDPNRTQSWSVNAVFRALATRSPVEWVFLTRSDFLLDYTCLQRFVAARTHADFITSYCHQMGYDAVLSNTDALAPYSLPEAAWRSHPDGPRSLVGQVPANYFHTTDQDAGVWLTRHALHAQVGGLNERMVSWGYQQQAFQRAIRRRGATIANIPEYLFHHQHHWANRDFAQAAAESRFEEHA